MIADSVAKKEKHIGMTIRWDPELLESFRDEVYRAQQSRDPVPTMAMCIHEAIGLWLATERGKHGAIAPARPWRGLRPGRARD